MEILCGFTPFNAARSFLFVNGDGSPAPPPPGTVGDISGDHVPIKRKKYIRLGCIKRSGSSYNFYRNDSNQRK